MPPPSVKPAMPVEEMRPSDRQPEAGGVQELDLPVSGPDQPVVAQLPQDPGHHLADAAHRIGEVLLGDPGNEARALLLFRGDVEQVPDHPFPERAEGRPRQLGEVGVQPLGHLQIEDLGHLDLGGGQGPDPLPVEPQHLVRRQRATAGVGGAVVENCGRSDDVTGT